MNTVAIPAWNALGLLPPIDPDLAISPHRSPYPVSLTDVVMRFSTSTNRRAILKGFLNYRAELHRHGFQNGFQWIDGSFLENIETIERRVPRDLDVVTFLHTPENTSSPDDERFLDHAWAKTEFKVDAYLVELDLISPRELTCWAAYWYSLWSHRRTQTWKG
ncbi:MAG: hypothetical protein CVU65_16875, partial [Deltaproteobacteria bacterium HGW-Deltaproteobacteria-22]